MSDRKTQLLKAALDYLNALEAKDFYAALGVTVHYDEADCDGICLRDDIECCLENGV